MLSPVFRRFTVGINLEVHHFNLHVPWFDNELISVTCLATSQKSPAWSQWHKFKCFVFCEFNAPEINCLWLVVSCLLWLNTKLFVCFVGNAWSSGWHLLFQVQPFRSKHYCWWLHQWTGLYTEQCIEHTNMNTLTLMPTMTPCPLVLL